MSVMTRDEITKTLKELRNSRKGLMSNLQTLQQRTYLIQGVALGLFYGIVGNILVSHYYGVFEGLAKAEYGNVFLASLIILIVGLVLIIFLSAKWHSQMEEFKTVQVQLSQNVTQLDTLIESYALIARYATEREQTAK